MAKTVETKQDEVKGVVEILHFAKPGFSAGKLYAGSRVVSFSVKGFVKHGQPVTLRGSWENHPKYGRQFKGVEVVHTMPADTEGIEAWLKCYASGFGPVKAKLAVKAFGVDLPRVFQESPEQASIELRLPLEYIQRIAELWTANASEVNAMTALLSHGLTQGEAEALYERFKGSSVTILEENPYALLGEISGFGWTRIDSLGSKFGVRPDDPRRLQAAFVEVLRVELGEGTTCIPAEGMMNSAADLAGAMFVESGALASSLADAIDAGRIIDLEGGYALPKPSRIEYSLWDTFEWMRRPNLLLKPLTPRDVETMRRLPTPAGEIILDDSQVTALEAAARTRGVAVCGGAGVGKTLIARAICRMYAACDYTIALCAPTGKAARRLTQVLGTEATTIHRLLGFDPESGGFIYNAKNLLPYELILMDECSMADSQLLWSLLQAAGLNTSVVLIGDPNQLPPVGPGYPLRDILAHDLIPAAKLTRCHRQAGYLAANSQEVLGGHLEPSVTECEGSPPWIKQSALSDAKLILNGVAFLFAGNPAKEIPAKLGEWGYAGLFDHQFMTAQHKGILGTMAVNELLQRLHQKTLSVELPVRDTTAERLPILLGDKVIQTKNNYQLGVMNGTLGIVTQEAPMMVSFEGEEPIELSKENQGELALAYCLTPHKMQGSQVPCAIVIVPKQHSYSQHRNWLYTAVTRAQKTAIVMGDPDGCRRAVETCQVDKRRTVLQHLAEVGHGSSDDGID